MEEEEHQQSSAQGLLGGGDNSSDDEEKQEQQPPEQPSESQAQDDETLNATAERLHNKSEKKKKKKRKKKSKKSHKRKPKLSDDGDVQPPEFKPGDVVEITGLTTVESEPLNGRRGRVINPMVTLQPGLIAVVLDGTSHPVSLSENRTINPNNSLLNDSNTHDDIGIPEYNLKYPDARKAWDISDEVTVGHVGDLPGTVDETDNNNNNTTNADQQALNRKTFGVLNHTGFKIVSESTMQLNEQPGTVTVAPSLGGTGLARMWLDRILSKFIQQSLTMLFGFVIAHQLYIEALFRDENHMRLIQSYGLLSTENSALFYVLAMFACTHIIEMTLQDRENFKPVSPPIAVAATCIVLTLILTVYAAEFEIDVGRYEDYECDFQVACPDDTALSDDTKDRARSWYNVNLARTVVTTICGISVILGRNEIEIK